jgi:hypothetical protein
MVAALVLDPMLRNVLFDAQVPIVSLTIVLVDEKSPLHRPFGVNHPVVRVVPSVEQCVGLIPSNQLN